MKRSDFQPDTHIQQSFEDFMDRLVTNIEESTGSQHPVWPTAYIKTTGGHTAIAALQGVSPTDIHAVMPMIFDELALKAEFPLYVAITAPIHGAWVGENEPDAALLDQGVDPLQILQSRTLSTFLVVLGQSKEDYRLLFLKEEKVGRRRFKYTTKTGDNPLPYDEVKERLLPLTDTDRLVYLDPARSN